VNEWLLGITQSNITAKDFRTWNACTLFLEEAIRQTSCAEGKALHIGPVLKSVAERLGNTPAILKKSYVHPELIDLYRTGCIMGKDWESGDAPAGRRKSEALLLRWLQKRYG
jgi:DNA topoisomerase I